MKFLAGAAFLAAATIAQQGANAAVQVTFNGDLTGVVPGTYTATMVYDAGAALTFDPVTLRYVNTAEPTSWHITVTTAQQNVFNFDLTTAERASVLYAAGKDLGYRFAASSPTLNAVLTFESANGPNAGTVLPTAAQLNSYFASAATSNLFLGFIAGIDSGTVTNFKAVDLTPTPTPAPAVPEPASWATMIGGLGAVGALLRRRGKLAPRAA